MNFFRFWNRCRGDELALRRKRSIRGLQREAAFGSSLRQERRRKEKLKFKKDWKKSLRFSLFEEYYEKEEGGAKNLREEKDAPKGNRGGI